MLSVLISVSDKTGIVDFARELIVLGWNIISTGVTAKFLKEQFIKCREIYEITEFPEILNGRVKTLNPKIYGGILAIRNKENHMKELEHHGIETIDMVVVNLYPFHKIINRNQKSKEKTLSKNVIENIDIGGVSLLRAAAKNYNDVIVICDIKDYKIVINSLKNNHFNNELRLKLAAKAFRHTAYYDSLISTYFTCEKFPKQMTIPLKKISELRYGENPHQKAVLYSIGEIKKYNGVISAKQIYGKKLSYNNYLDLESGWCLISEFDNFACAIIKHNNPSGCAESKSNLKDAYLKALSCDPISAFGSVVIFNKFIDENLAMEIEKLFVECIIAPDYSHSALNILMRKKNIRILKQEILYKKFENSIEYKMLSYGMLVQDKNNRILGEVENMTKRSPTIDEKEALYFALKIVKHVKSNAIVIASGTMTVGIGTGQMSRIDSLKIAIRKMKEFYKSEHFSHLVLASDAFLTFPDIIEESAKIGITAIIQPGGSIRDKELIKIANDKNIAMIATKVRHFKH
ncbi:MAG: bifunctional phosphoribosylaminoimidazolecarboxamide formyltransferase/IMP cyclohydrolase [Endomicrobium sp.]|jgi:phosphoribosylaminoimidazolecarboxamide formyltransferase/IMP cyclohydrolase|nr:bifunctional phosphoribosylaminoimidazolecarboxamide formyltransferase/IMP cyclohydrolase [Endomicrobium sp.]